MTRSRPRRKTPVPRAPAVLPTLSVVLPAYKVAPYLERCLDALLTDAPPGLELIVVDDGSPDDAGEIAERRAASDPRIRVIHQDNAGVVAARNAGLDAATGDYVGFADPDDMVERSWARALLQAAARQRPAIVRGEWRMVLPDGRSPPHASCEEVVQRPNPLRWYGQIWAAIYRRDFLAAHHLRHPAGCIYSEDIDFQVRAVVAAMTAGESIIPCPQACYLYLRREGSGDSRALSHAQVDSVLGVLEGLHALLTAQALHLPDSGVAMQYHTWIANLITYYAPKAYDQGDAVRCRELAQRLMAECPVPAELQRMQQSVPVSGGGRPRMVRGLQAMDAGMSTAAVPAPQPAASAAPPQPFTVPAPVPITMAPDRGLAGAGEAAATAAPPPHDLPAPGPVEHQPAALASDPYATLLRRARQLLGEPDGAAAGGAELLRCLRRLYRTQNRCEPGALRQLGRDCLEALESGVLESSAELLAAAKALVRQAPD